MLIPVAGFGQEFVVNNGTDVQINPGCQVILADGGIQNSSGQLTNSGELVIEGNLINDGLLSGNTSGFFRVLGDVENNGQMQPGQSLFELYGDDQFLRGSQQLNFYDLTLLGSGVKYMLQNISTAGALDLTDRELRAFDNTVLHTNTNAATILSVYNEGFISADAGGGLSRKTSGSANYFFPVGSTVNNFRIRPISIAPQGGDNTYKVRYAPGPTVNAIQRGPELYYVNPAYYHEAQITEGNTPARLTVYYDELEDGFFETLAQLENAFWRESAGTIEGGVMGTGPELTSFESPTHDFSNSEIALAAYASELFVPNVFSPNDDGHNDVFKPRGTEPFAYELRIYDRWGNLVFNSGKIGDGWDGTHNGKPLNSGVFVFYILSGDNVMEKGNVTLLR
ncbi:MAG: gliding motility-associated C-terminal domain-containing protein [Flavobacteriales bacterium]